MDVEKPIVKNGVVIGANGVAVPFSKQSAVYRNDQIAAAGQQPVYVGGVRAVEFDPSYTHAGANGDVRGLTGKYLGNDVASQSSSITGVGSWNNSTEKNMFGLTPDQAAQTWFAGIGGLAKGLGDYFTEKMKQDANKEMQANAIAANKATVDAEVARRSIVGNEGKSNAGILGTKVSYNKTKVN